MAMGRRCSARCADRMYIQCDLMAAEAAVHTEPHTGLDRDGIRVHWHEEAAMYPAVGQVKRRAAISTANPAREAQVGGDHYKKLALQPWDIWEALDLGAFEGSIIKYVLRYKDKNGVEDLKKARHTLDRLIEIVEARNGGS